MNARFGMLFALLVPLSATRAHAAAAPEPGRIAAKTAAAPPAAATSRTTDPVSLLCDLGIQHALGGRAAAAESAFVAMLARAPEDARALNNLGNLALWRDDASVASAFYRAAAEADSADAGILLNAATAMLVGGEDAEADRLAAEGVRRAGGVDRAAALMGLPAPALARDSTRAGDRTRLEEERVRMLLGRAGRSVPSDSTVRAARGTAQSGAPSPGPSWRPAGVRASDAIAAPPVVYWKR